MEINDKFGKTARKIGNGLMIWGLAWKIIFSAIFLYVLSLAGLSLYWVALVAVLICVGLFFDIRKFKRQLNYQKARSNLTPEAAAADMVQSFPPIPQLPLDPDETIAAVFPNVVSVVTRFDDFVESGLGHTPEHLENTLIVTNKHVVCVLIPMLDGDPRTGTDSFAMLNNFFPAKTTLDNFKDYITATPLVEIYTKFTSNFSFPFSDIEKVELSDFHRSVNFTLKSGHKFSYALMRKDPYNRAKEFFSKFNQ